jgi:hypothetical protein
MEWDAIAEFIVADDPTKFRLAWQADKARSRGEPPKNTDCRLYFGFLCACSPRQIRVRALAKLTVSRLGQETLWFAARGTG